MLDIRRWQVWKACLTVDQRRIPGLFQKLAVSENRWTSLISIDVPRTFAQSHKVHDSGLSSLGRILNAYANLNPEVGYCQGMNFLVGLLVRVIVPKETELTPILEEDVFWVFVCLMDYDGLRDFYKDGFPLLLRYTSAFFELMKSEVPDLHKHFDKEGITPSLFLHQWYLSLFINCLPFPTVLILWDSIICEGLPVILSVSISLLKVLRNVLLKMEFEQIIRFFKTMKNGDEECDAKIIGQLLVKQAALITIPKSILRSLNTSGPPVPTSPWTSVPVFPILFPSEPSRSDSPSILQRVWSAFATSNSGDDDNS